MDFSVTHNTLELYKLIILYMLDQVDFSLSQSQISDFILEHNYTNYLVLQQSLSQLAESGLVRTHSTMNRTTLTITEEGKNTLGYFEGQISDAIKKDIDLYFAEHSLRLRDQISISSNYYKSTGGDYETILIAKDRESSLVEIRLFVPTVKLADSICENWRKKNQEIYESLTRMLF